MMIDEWSIHLLRLRCTRFLENLMKVCSLHILYYLSNRRATVVVHLSVCLSFVTDVLKKAKSSTCCSASYMRRTQDQKSFTILEVAADWHELMIPQYTMWPSIARANKQLDPQFAASRHTIAPISHTRPSPRSP